MHLCGCAFWWEGAFNKGDICSSVRARVSVVLVSRLCVHAQRCEDCVSAFRVFLLLAGRAALCPGSGGSG